MSESKVDHSFAQAKGRTNHIDNLQLLCGHCNSVKGDRGMKHLRTKLELASG
ncbi:MAG: HNH endonuclease [Chloroflexi bacterium]|nr:HNH endonuclease [Chloroflexota bacterium]